MSVDNEIFSDVVSACGITGSCWRGIGSPSFLFPSLFNEIPMDAQMLILGNDEKVRWGVIECVSVDVMHFFFTVKIPPLRLFRNEPVEPHVSALRSVRMVRKKNLDIPSMSYGNSTMKRMTPVLGKSKRRTLGKILLRHGQTAGFRAVDTFAITYFARIR
jgi:hypothetical protein